MTKAVRGSVGYRNRIDLGRSDEGGSKRMTAKSRRGLFAAFAVGIIAVLAIGASRASANSVTGQPVAFKAFVDNGFDGSIISTAGASVNAECSGQTLTLDLVGTASNG